MVTLSFFTNPAQNLLQQKSDLTFEEDEEKMEILLDIVLALAEQNLHQAIEVAYYGLTISIPIISKETLQVSSTKFT